MYAPTWHGQQEQKLSPSVMNFSFNNLWFVCTHYKLNLPRSPPGGTPSPGSEGYPGWEITRVGRASYRRRGTFRWLSEL